MNELSDQVRGIIFVLLVVAITFVWLHFYQPPVPPPQKAGQTATQTSPATGAGSAQATGQGTAQSSVSAVPARPVSIAAIQASEEKLISVDSTLYRVELSNRGGVVRM